jgi:hypothetical protein
MSRFMKIMLLAGLALLVIVLPLAAQTATPEPGTTVVVVGAVDLQSGGIMVNGYQIAPASAFQPAILRQGDEVIIIGNLLPNGQVIQAVSIEFFEPTPEATPDVTPEVTLEPTAEVTPEVTLEPTIEVTPEVTVEPTAEVTAEPTPDTGACNNPNHPVATNLAASFSVSYDEIIGWHCAGFGFGEIARAYLLADASGLTPQSYFDQKNAGMGWGQIVREAGVHPSDLAPGQVIRHGGRPEASADVNQTQGDGNRNNGNGGGNGNNGNNSNNGNGNGGGNGNNGNGNGGGNGGGNGNGNGNGGNGGGNGNNGNGNN